MKNEHVFISDVHLGIFSPSGNTKLEQELIELINYCTSEKVNVYVLGDLFDYWMEFSGSSFVPNIGKEVLDAFEKYNRLVAPAVFVTGNHDNWTISHFKNRGFLVEQDYRVIELETKKAMLFHGDATFDANGKFVRPALHQVLRNKRFVKTFQFLFPNQKGIDMMKGFSAFTRLRNGHNPDPLNKNAEWILSNKNVDLVICGHDHIPRTETFLEGRYINLGAFYKHRTIARYSESEINLVRWKSESKEFVPYTNN